MSTELNEHKSDDKSQAKVPPAKVVGFLTVALTLGLLAPELVERFATQLKLLVIAGLICH